jgi:hypothetical protein
VSPDPKLRPQTVRPLKFKWSDIVGLLFVAIVIAHGLYQAVKYPFRARPTGFGPEWECNMPGRIGSDFCIKKPTTEPLKP